MAKDTHNRYVTIIWPIISIITPYSLALLTDQIGLQAAGEDLVDDAVAARIVLHGHVGAFAVVMKHVEGGDEKLVSILLFVTCQMTSMRPD